MDEPHFVPGLRASEIRDKIERFEHAMDPLAFIGVRVNVTLRNGLSVHATVRTIEHEDGRAVLRLEHGEWPLTVSITGRLTMG